MVREYKRRGLPIDVIVVDFFHWPKQGEWKFDPTYWPDPDAMVKELNNMGIEHIQARLELGADLRYNIQNQ